MRDWSAARAHWCVTNYADAQYSVIAGTQNKFINIF